MGTPIISIMEWNGDSAKTDKTSSTIRFKNADNATVDSNNPLPIPGAGRFYSFEKWLRLRVGSGDKAEQLANLKFYTDGTNSFGGNVFLLGHQAADFTYDFRSACAPSTNNTPARGGSGSLSFTSVMFYTAAGGYSLSSAAETFSGSSTDIGRFVVLVMKVDPGATPGTLTAETLSFSYDTSAAAVTSNQNLSLSLAAVLNATVSSAGLSVTLNGVVGKAVDDSGFRAVAGVESRIPQLQFLYNDFTPITSTGLDSASTTVTYIETIASATNGSATISEGVVSVFASGAGAVSVYYVANFSSAVSTGSVALTATAFADEALIFNAITLLENEKITENRSGTTRATGLNSEGLIVAFASGEQRYKADFDSAHTPLGLVVEGTGGNALTNPNWSGGTTTPTSWNAPPDPLLDTSIRSATASVLGSQDGATAFVHSGNGRPRMADSFTFSSGITYTNSMVVESIGTITGNRGIISVTTDGDTGITSATAGEVLFTPCIISHKFVCTVTGAGEVRYGLGVNATANGTITISRPMLVKGKSARPTYTPDSTVGPDRPTVNVGSSFPFNSAAGAFVIQAKTAPYFGTQVLFHIDAGSAGNRHCCYRESGGHFHYLVTTNDVDVADIIYSSMPNDTTVRIAIDYSASGAYLLVDSASIALSDTAFTFPSALTIMRIGHDVSGQHWNGTISEFNVYRSPRGIARNLGIEATPASKLPFRYYGVGAMASAMDGTQLNAAGKQVSYRFRADKSATATSVRWYNAWNLSVSGYNRYSGSNTFGPGGVIRARIFQNDPNAGAAGTAAHVPSFTSQVGTTGFYSAHDVYVASATVTTRFPTISISAVLSSSGIYHLVFDNTHADPDDNFTTVLGLAQSWAPTPHTPAQPDMYEEVLERLSSVNTWTREPRMQCLQIGYADGSVQGRPYMDVNVDNNDSQWLAVGGSNQIRQTFMPDETFVAEQFWLGGYTESANTALTCTIRQESNGFVKDTLTIPATALNTFRYSWLSANTSAGATYSASVTYHWTLSSTSGNYRFKTLRDGAAGIYGLSGLIGVKGYAQYSTDSGSAFNGVTIDFRTGSTEGDYEFFFVKP